VFFSITTATNCRTSDEDADVDGNETKRVHVSY